MLSVDMLEIWALLQQAVLSSSSFHSPCLSQTCSAHGHHAANQLVEYFPANPFKLCQAFIRVAVKYPRDGYFVARPLHENPGECPKGSKGIDIFM